MVGVGSSRNASGLLMMVSPILCSRWLANRLGSRVTYPHWQTRMYPGGGAEPDREGRCAQRGQYRRHEFGEPMRVDAWWLWLVCDGHGLFL